MVPLILIRLYQAVFFSSVNKLMYIFLSKKEKKKKKKKKKKKETLLIGNPNHQMVPEVLDKGLDVSKFIVGHMKVHRLLSSSNCFVIK